ncbi:MAG: hypothetical protein QOG58_3258, partial [Caballeronia sp.]|nr:hypothetical protein [Caballeronia sp.]
QLVCIPLGRHTSIMQACINGNGLRRQMLLSIQTNARRHHELIDNNAPAAAARAQCFEWFVRFHDISGSAASSIIFTK